MLARAHGAAAGRPVPVVDGLLAATVPIHDLIIVTRNAKNLGVAGARVLDPWTRQPGHLGKRRR